MVGISENSRKELRELLKEHQLMDYADVIEQHAEGYIYLTIAEEDTYQQVGNTRIGGVPDLPPTFEWAKTDEGYMRFLAQVNLAELPALPDSPLPEQGMLYFFSKMQDQNNQHRILFFDGDPDDLKRATAPPEGEIITNFYPPRNTAWKVTIGDGFEFPHEDNRFYYRDLFFTNNDRIDEQAAAGWYELTEDLYYDYRPQGQLQMSKILGEPDSLLHDRLMQMAQAVREGKSWSSVYNGYKSDESEVKKWILLLQLDSHHEAGMLWSDAGFLDFVIHGDDLAKRDFSRTYASIASS